MATHFEVYGPYKLDRIGDRLDKDSLDELWESFDKDGITLATAIGVYVIAIQKSEQGIIRPWYVGKTEKQGFKKRISQQLNRFRDVLEKNARGNPIIFFIPRRTSSGRTFMRVKKKSQRRVIAIDFLESMLIGSCLDRNKHLINASKIKFLREMYVPGYLNDRRGRLDDSGSEFRKMLSSK